MDDGSKVNISTHQTMCCVVCYFGHNVPTQHSTCGKPRMISYDKNNGTKTLSKHVWKIHKQELSKWIIYLQHNKRQAWECQPNKKRNYPSPYAITKFTRSYKPYHKNDPAQWAFLEDLTMYITKDHCPLSTITNPWLKHLVLCQCEKVVFPSNNVFVNEMLFNMVNLIVEKFLNPMLANCMTWTTTFDLWMSWSNNDTFAVVSFINSLCVPCHVTIGLFTLKVLLIL